MHKPILILGATGRTGKLILTLALEQGLQVNVLVRDKTKVPSHPSLTIYQGSPTDRNALDNAMNGCGAVVSALNISRTSDFPWSKLRTPSNFLSQTARLLINLMPKHGIDRVIITSAWGTNDTRRHIPWWFGWVIDHSNVGVAYRDHELQERLFESSSLSYTIVRPVGLVNPKRLKSVSVSFNDHPKPRLIIGRLDVAAFILNCLRGDLYIKQMPVIFNT